MVKRGSWIARIVRERRGIAGKFGPDSRRTESRGLAGTVPPGRSEEVGRRPDRGARACAASRGADRDVECEDVAGGTMSMDMKTGRWVMNACRMDGASRAGRAGGLLSVAEAERRTAAPGAPDREVPWALPEPVMYDEDEEESDEDEPFGDDEEFADDEDYDEEDDDFLEDDEEEAEEEADGDDEEDDDDF